ncbi:MAG TPA: SRPBCC family protein [Acidimicrobiales bacterium]|nr:SRPBCC family protein [Acidimicrobiales bacterium]
MTMSAQPAQSTQSARSAEHGTFTITRTYPVPPARVFAAWASTEAKGRWFGGGGGVGPALELDFRVGGTETIRAGSGDGPVHTYEATYKDIVTDERIVYGYTMDADGKRISVSVTTVEFTPASGGGSTTLTFTEQGVFLDGGDTPAIREKGTAELLDQLGAALA